MMIYTPFLFQTGFSPFPARHIYFRNSQNPAVLTIYHNIASAPNPELTKLNYAMTLLAISCFRVSVGAKPPYVNL